jgi:hypothetical protein
MVLKRKKMKKNAEKKEGKLPLVGVAFFLFDVKCDCAQ